MMSDRGCGMPYGSPTQLRFRGVFSTCGTVLTCYPASVFLGTARRPMLRRVQSVSHLYTVGIKPIVSPSMYMITNATQ